MSWTVKRIARVKQDVPDGLWYSKYRGQCFTLVKKTQTTKGKLTVVGCASMQIPIEHLDILGEVD